MSDFELRSAQRRVYCGDRLDEARYLRAQLRRGMLRDERLRVAAALGYPAAREALGSSFSVPEPSARRHWWRRKVRNALNRIDRWAADEDDEDPLPYTGDLREWIQGLGSLGLPACAEASRVVVRQVSHDWLTVVDCLELFNELAECRTPAAAATIAGDIAVRASRIRDPEDLRRAIRDGLIAWALDREPDLQCALPEPEVREAEDAPPIVKLANRIIEDAYSRGATQIVIESLGESDTPAPGTLSVLYDVKGERTERMRIPRRAGSPLVARYKFMAGLDVLVRTDATGAVHYEQWSRRGLKIELRIAVEAFPYVQRCKLELLMP
jgi:hypothetical protein